MAASRFDCHLSADIDAKKSSMTKSVDITNNNNNNIIYIYIYIKVITLKNDMALPRDNINISIYPHAAVERSPRSTSYIYKSLQSRLLSSSASSADGALWK